MPSTTYHLLSLIRALSLLPLVAALALIAYFRDSLYAHLHTSLHPHYTVPFEYAELRFWLDALLWVPAAAQVVLLWVWWVKLEDEVVTGILSAPGERERQEVWRRKWWARAEDERVRKEQGRGRGGLWRGMRRKRGEMVAKWFT